MGLGEEERFAYRRAVSRLIEMTSERYAATAQWSPIPAEHRKWEGYGYSRHRHRPVGEVASVDLQHPYHGSSSGSVVKERPGPAAPRLRDEHIWGVRDDWGDKAGEWGKGVKVYEKKKGR